MIFLRLKVEEGVHEGILFDYFKGHNTDATKDSIECIKSGDGYDEDEDRHELVDFHIIGGRVTLKPQPLNLLLVKIIKGHYRDVCDLLMLVTPKKSMTGHPFLPSRQLCT